LANRQTYQFGSFRLDASGRILFDRNRAVSLPPKAAETLLVLVQRAGEIVEKERLLQEVWRDTIVEEGSLTRTVSILRKVLHEGKERRQFIATVSKKGYRFVAPVTQMVESPVPSASERVMLAVLPFENLSKTAKQDYFSDGLTEEMIGELGRLNPDRMGVIARTSAMKYKGTKKSIGEIGAELGVSYMLEGSVRRGRGRVRIAAQLIRVSDETHVWSETYDRSLGDILKLQSEVARAIAAQIQVKLTSSQQRRHAETAEVAPEAYEAYLKGRHLWNRRTEDGMRKSITQYEEAIRHHPEYASAYAGIADSHVMLACRGIVPAKETFRKAKVAAEKALLFDSQLGEAHGSLAHVRLHDWDWEGLEEEFRLAIDLRPTNAIIYYWYAEFLMSMGRPDDAVEMARCAYRMDPLSPVIAASLAMILYLARRYDHAVEVLAHAQEIDPDHFLPHMRMGLVRTQQGEYDDAIRELKTASQLADQSTETKAALAMAYAAAGTRKLAQVILRHLQKPEEKRYVLPYNIAKIHAAGGNTEKAFQWLEIAYEGGNPDLIELNSEPVFDGMRGDSRFSSLMRRIGWKA
jgi:TolB-like protein/Tfp pilus assembly protein PilF